MTEPAPRRRRVVVTVTALSMLALAAVWGLNQVTKTATDVPDAGASSMSPSQVAPQPGADYDPAAQSEVPGAPVGDTDGVFTMWMPSLNVASAVVPIVSTEDRRLLPPQDPLLAGWWRDGAAPGDERGTVVIAGHAVHGGESAFNEVSTLGVGDGIVVFHESAPLWYRVTSVEVLSEADLADQAEEFFDQDAASRLVVVTCTDWDGTRFRSNVVVTAEPAEPGDDVQATR